MASPGHRAEQSEHGGEALTFYYVTFEKVID
jgi:hypothetical protein